MQQILTAAPSGNVVGDRAELMLKRVVEEYHLIRPAVQQQAVERGQELLEAHRRVRDVVRRRQASVDVQPEGEADVLGIYVYLPAQAAGRDLDDDQPSPTA